MHHIDQHAVQGEKSEELIADLRKRFVDLHDSGTSLEMFINNCRFQDHQFKQLCIGTCYCEVKPFCWKKNQTVLPSWMETGSDIRNHEGSDLPWSGICWLQSGEFYITMNWESPGEKKEVPSLKSTPSSSNRGYSWAHEVRKKVLCPHKTQWAEELRNPAADDASGQAALDKVTWRSSEPFSRTSKQLNSH